jgi:hypothetical protein
MTERLPDADEDDTYCGRFSGGRVDPDRAPTEVIAVCQKCGLNGIVEVGEYAWARAVARKLGHPMFRPWTVEKIAVWLLAAMVAAAIGFSDGAWADRRMFYKINGNLVSVAEVKQWIGLAVFPFFLVGAALTWERRYTENCPSCGKVAAKFFPVDLFDALEKDTLYQRYGFVLKYLLWIAVYVALRAAFA